MGVSATLSSLHVIYL